MNHSMSISNTANIWLNAGENEQRSGEKRLPPGAGFPDGIFFLVSIGRWPNGACGRSSPGWVRPRNSLPLSALTICAIRLPGHCLIQLRMDWIVHRCHFQRFSSCSAMLTLRQRPSICLRRGSCPDDGDIRSRLRQNCATLIYFAATGPLP